MSIEYYIADSECTGLKANFHEIFELSMIRYSDKNILSKKIKCLYPKRANYDSLKITNKTINDLYHGESRESVVTKFDNFLLSDNKPLNGRCIVAYNDSFDRRFIHALWHQVGKKFQADLWIDPLKIMRDYVKQKNMGKVKLDLTSACDMFGIKKYAAHTAMGDTKRTYFLFKKILEDLNIDILPYIKTIPHIINSKKQEQQEDDLSILDNIEIPF